MAIRRARHVHVATARESNLPAGSTPLLCGRRTACTTRKNEKESATIATIEVDWPLGLGPVHPSRHQWKHEREGGGRHDPVSSCHVLHRARFRRKPDACPALRRADRLALNGPFRSPVCASLARRALARPRISAADDLEGSCTIGIAALMGCVSVRGMWGRRPRRWRYRRRREITPERRGGAELGEGEAGEPPRHRPWRGCRTGCELSYAAACVRVSTICLNATVVTLGGASISCATAMTAVCLSSIVLQKVCAGRCPP